MTRLSLQRNSVCLGGPGKVCDFDARANEEMHRNKHCMCTWNDKGGVHDYRSREQSHCLAVVVKVWSWYKLWSLPILDNLYILRKTFVRKIRVRLELAQWNFALQDQQLLWVESCIRNTQAEADEWRARMCAGPANWLNRRREFMISPEIQKGPEDQEKWNF